MAPTYTVDASVFLNAFHPSELGHESSRRLLALIQANAVPIIVPTLLLPEIAAIISRGQNDGALARRFAQALARLPNLLFISLDMVLAQQAIEVAATYRLRGSDAIYIAVALRFGSVLVSLDQEQLTRSPGVLVCYRPDEALANWGHP